MRAPPMAWFCSAAWPVFTPKLTSNAFIGCESVTATALKRAERRLRFSFSDR